MQFCLCMYSLCSTLLPLPPALKWSFKGFDKSVAEVSGFIVTSVSAFSERLFLCYLEKFTSVSLWRTLKSALIYQKGKGYYFSLLSLLWKGTEGISEEGKQVMKGKWSFWETPLQLLFFFFWYYDRSLNMTLETYPSILPSHSPPWKCVLFFTPAKGMRRCYRDLQTPTPQHYQLKLAFDLCKLTSRTTGQSFRIDGHWQGWKEWEAFSYSPGFSGIKLHTCPPDHPKQPTDHWRTIEIYRTLTRWLDYTKLSRCS